MTCGRAGPASSSRLAFELFKEAAGIEIDPIHYKGGGPAINDLVAGTVQVMLIQAGGSIGQNIQAGQLLGRDQRGRRRAPQSTRLPTIRQVLPGVGTNLWGALVRPGGATP